MSILFLFLKAFCIFLVVFDILIHGHRMSNHIKASQSDILITSITLGMAIAGFIALQWGM